MSLSESWKGTFTRGNGFKLRGEIYIRYKKEILYYEGGEAVPRSCGCPLPGSVQGHAEWGFDQPGLMKGVPAHGRGVWH